MLCFLLLMGCKDSNQDKLSESKEDTEKFVLKKNDETKDFVYFKDYKQIQSYDNNIYNLKIPVINIKSDDVDNVNLELKSFVTNSYKDFLIVDEMFTQGNIIDYEYYVTDDYVSIIQKYYLYIDGMIGEEQDNVYVISLKNGKVLNNQDLLDNFGFDEDKLFELLEEKIVSEDVAFSLMNIKEEGYKLFVNKNNNLCIIYYELFDDSIRKELVLS